MHDPVISRLQNNIAALVDKKRQLRQQINSLGNVQVGVPTASNQGSKLGPYGLLKKIIPAHLLPGNVGKWSQVAWPFYYETQHDFGTNPALTSTSEQTDSFTVSQEAAFLLTSVSWNAIEQNDESGFLGPYQITIRDRQSSRQFNDTPIPVQMIGRNSKPTYLVTPFLILPNATIEVRMNTWIPAGITQNTTGSGLIQLAYGGYRVRLGPASRSAVNTTYDEAEG